jgi:hypothetical protein
MPSKNITDESKKKRSILWRISHLSKKKKENSHFFGKKTFLKKKKLFPQNFWPILDD